MRTTIKQMKYVLSLLVMMIFYGSNGTKACNLNAGFTYTFDTTYSFIRFNFTSSSDTTIASWKYDFGDGTYDSVLMNPVHTFNHHNGNYNVCLSVIDNNGCRDTFCAVINYSTICQPNPSFLDYYKRAECKVTRYTKPNGDIYYLVVSKFAYSYNNLTGYNLFDCTGLQICADTSDNCTNQNRPFIDSAVIWNQADTLNSVCESSWLNHYTDYNTNTELHITNGFIYDQQIQLLKDSVIIGRNAWVRRGFIFYVYDANVGQNWQTYQVGNTCRGPYNDITCGRYPSNVIEFITRDSTATSMAKQERKYLINFLNSIPCNAYVLGYSFFNAGYNQWLSDSTQASDSTLFSAFERLGITNIRQQQENHPFVFFTQNCNASFPTSQLQTSVPNIIDTSFTYPNTFTGSNGCKNQSIKRYYSNQFGIVYEVTPINSTNATYYYDCNENVLLYCGAATDTFFCRRLNDSLIYLNTVWQCQSLCDTVTCMLPGDGDHDLTVNNFDALAIGLSYNRIGIVRPNATTEYTLQSCPNWSTTHNYGFNDKFADCNGDGIINENDLLVIDQNYIVQPENIFHHRLGILDSLPAVKLSFDSVPVRIETATCISAQLTADINVGSATQPATDVYGIAFTVNYPFENDSCFSVQVELDSSSWFQTNNHVLLFYKNIPQYKRVDIAIVRTDGIGRTGNGRIGKIKMITEGDIFGIVRRTVNSISFDFSVSAVAAVNKDGVRIDMNGSATSVNFIVLGNKYNKVEGLKIYPNPTNDKIFISAKENIESIKIIDTQGRIINEFSPNKNDAQLDISSTENGMYILEIKSKNAVSYEKIFKQ